MVSGRARVWPITWPRWLLAKRVKSGMFSDTVDQNPTVALRAGTSVRKKEPAVLNFEGAASMGPNPPAVKYAQPSSSKPTPSKIGALMPWRKRMYSMPRMITSRLMAQNARKQIGTP